MHYSEIKKGERYAVYGFGMRYSKSYVCATALNTPTSWNSRVRLRVSDDDAIVTRVTSKVHSTWASHIATIENNNRTMLEQEARMAPVTEAYAILQDAFLELGLKPHLAAWPYKHRGEESPTINLNGISFEQAFALVKVMRQAHQIAQLSDPMFPPTAPKEELTFQNVVSGGEYFPSAIQALADQEAK